MIAAPAPPTYTLRTVGGYLFLSLVLVGLQSSLAFRLELFGAKPDFLLTLALCAGLLTEGVGGAAAGFLAGLFTVAVMGNTVGTYLISRTVAAWLVAVLRKRLVRTSVWVTVIGVALGTVVAGILFGLSVPRIGLSRWLSATFASTLINALVALPITLVLRVLLPRS